MSTTGKGPNAVWTVREILNWTTKYFSDLALPTPLLDSQLLLGHVLNASKVQLYLDMERPLSSDERSTMRALVKQRALGAPVAYLLKQKHWHSLDLQVDERVLIPRPETETMLDVVLNFWRQSTETPKVILDFCTGSGCLAIALAKEFPKARVIGIDISEDALEVAKINAERNGVPHVEFLLGNLSRPAFFTYLRTQFEKASIIVANPPYISEEDWMQLDISVKNFEPKVALVAEDKGEALGKNIMHSVLTAELLAENSIFAMELGEDQPRSIHRSLSHPNEFQEFSSQIETWKMPRKELFGVRDLEDRGRFLFMVHGHFPLKKHLEKNENFGLDPTHEQSDEPTESNTLSKFEQD